MKFEEIIINTFDSIHKYLVKGELTLKYTEPQEAIAIEVTLSVPIAFPSHLEASSIEIHGLEFECTIIAINKNKIFGVLMKIDSQEYAKQFKR